MGSENSRSRVPVPTAGRRKVLRSIGAATASGTSILAFSGSTVASHCPDPNSDETYQDCDDVSNEFSFFYRPDERHVNGETSVGIGLKGFQRSYCSNCVYYFFDITGQHEAYGETTSRGGKDYVKNFGFRWDTSSNVIADPQPENSSNVQSGVTDPDGETSPDGSDVEEAFWALGDVLVAGGTVLYPQYSVPAFLYTVARSADLGHENNNENNEVVFNDSWRSGNLDSAGFGYYNLRLQIPDDEYGSVKFEGFTDTATTYGRKTIETKTFYLDDHFNSNIQSEEPV